MHFFLIDKIFKKKRVPTPRFFLCSNTSKIKIAELNILLAAVLLLVSCTSNETEQQQAKYFNVRNFFEGEAKRLSAEHFVLKKRTVLDTKQDSIFLNQVDWKKEFDLFTNADINKPAWKNSFRIDSINSDSTLSLLYTALDSSISVRKMQINKVGNKLTSLFIRKSSTNFIYKTVQELKYTSNTEFSIEGSQNVLWFYHTSYSVTGIPLKK